MLKSIAKKIIPEKIKKQYRKKELNKQQAYVKSLHKLTENRLSDILQDELGIKKGDVVFIHSSINGLNLDFPSYLIIKIFLDTVGKEGTILFPTYPKLNSYKFLKSGEIFNIRKTPSYTGILSEFARRQKNAIRSLHPTKSVVAIGPKASELTSEHHISRYPYDINSPYYKITKCNAKIIGIGVKTTYLSAVHTVDDVLKDKFPVNPYHKELFHAKCIDYDGNERIVKTYAHNMSKMGFDLPAYFKKNIPSEICKDINIQGMNFFKADAKRMFDYMINLAMNDNITIYKY